MKRPHPVSSVIPVRHLSVAMVLLVAQGALEPSTFTLVATRMTPNGSVAPVLLFPPVAVQQARRESASALGRPLGDPTMQLQACGRASMQPGLPMPQPHAAVRVPSPGMCASGRHGPCSPSGHPGSILALSAIWTPPSLRLGPRWPLGE